MSAFNDALTADQFNANVRCTLTVPTVILTPSAGAPGTATRKTRKARPNRTPGAERLIWPRRFLMPRQRSPKMKIQILNTCGLFIVVSAFLVASAAPLKQEGTSHLQPESPLAFA